MENRIQGAATSEYRRPYDEAEEWDFDDAQEELRSRHHRNHSHEQQPPNLSFMQNMGSFLPAASARLPYPVIIPQRRPKNRDRGFIRAYAPDLMLCGIDEPTFMAFLDNLDRATAGSSWITAINIAGGAAGLIPTAIAPPIGLAVRITASVYQEMRSRKHQNEFLLKMNDELFRPRGLYCLILAYNPESKSALLQEDLNAHFGDNSRSEYRSNDGMTGSVQFPASAELVFPSLEDSSSDEQEGESSLKGSFMKALEGYSERRDLKAQRKYQRKNPASDLGSLMDPQVELTAKDIKKQERRLEKQERRQEKDERKQEKRERKVERKARKHPDRVPKGPRERKIKEGILYLMIVNMPTTEEMESAVRLVEGETR
ncbi:hypothetical protein F5Y04DRAFT_52503 [Hypomontagnella monticulosa]|nr:hypothetical protein F5Y04DRAFT_52503 [Hypomontagnella monticulosa]